MDLLLHILRRNKIMKHKFKYKPTLKFILQFILVSSLTFSCKNPHNPQPAPSGNYQQGVFIINEGGYGHGDASVDFYHKDKDTLERNVFENVNGHPLGDVLESVTHWNGHYFMVLNSSYDIVVANDKSLKLESVINHLTLPRYLNCLSNQKAYLTNETANEITIIDPSAFTVIGHIPYKPGPDSLASWTEQMVSYNNFVYAAAVKTGKLLVINTLTDKITDTINLSIGAIDVALDNENKIWVLCDGTIAIPNIHSKLYRIDPVSHSIIQQFTFPNINSGVGNLCMTPAGDSLFYVNGGIYKMGIHATTIPSGSFISGNDHNFYGLAIDPENNTIYAGDILNFSQTGKTFQYSSTGKLLKVHNDGVGPNGFLFVK